MLNTFGPETVSQDDPFLCQIFLFSFFDSEDSTAQQNTRTPDHIKLLADSSSRAGGAADERCARSMSMFRPVMGNQWVISGGRSETAQSEEGGGSTGERRDRWAAKGRHQRG